MKLIDDTFFCSHIVVDVAMFTQQGRPNDSKVGTFFTNRTSN
jgi:hypothetical protein